LGLTVVFRLNEVYPAVHPFCHWFNYSSPVSHNRLNWISMWQKILIYKFRI